HRPAEHADALAGALRFCVPAERLTPVVVGGDVAGGVRAPDPEPHPITRQGLGVAMIAASRDLGAAEPRVEGSVRPGNQRLVGHGHTLQGRPARTPQVPSSYVPPSVYAIAARGCARLVGRPELEPW